MVCFWLFERKCWGIIVSTILAGILVTGCVYGRKETAPAPVPDPDMSRRISALENRNQKLRNALASKEEENQSLEKDIVQLNMQLLEQKALLEDIQLHADRQQNWLDAAIVEVVRTKARLQSLESKAEAASTMAEAEIAVNALKKKIDTVDAPATEELGKAEQLLEMSEKEFKSLNFGGALYLANQAKGQVRAIQFKFDDRNKADAEGGETLFAHPLPLKTMTNSNMREGPGLDQKIIATLKKDTLVTGKAYKGGWIRVETWDGKTGWLFQPLLGSR